jgi:hypothetical protein
MRRRIIVTVWVFLLAALIAGCGGGADPPPPGSASAAENLIKPSEIREQPAGSPQAAFLSWWMSVQYNDLQGYTAALAEPLRKRREEEGTPRRDLPLVSGDLSRSKPKIVSVRHSGGSATIFTRVETRQPVGATRFTTSSYPQAFTLVRQAGRWKVANDYFIQGRAAAVRKALSEAQ